MTSGQATEARWDGLDASGRRWRVMLLAVAGTCTSPRKMANLKRIGSRHRITGCSDYAELVHVPPSHLQCCSQGTR